MWISAEFKIYLIKEFQRLKEEESVKLHSEWSVSRTLAKINYKIHTEAIKQNLIPETLTKSQVSVIYANEADILNVAIFGSTSSEWKKQNPNKEGNMRDFAELEQLIVLSNLESINSMLIQQKLNQSQRLIQLNNIAIQQMKTLIKNEAIKKLKN